MEQIYRIRMSPDKSKDGIAQNFEIANKESKDEPQHKHAAQIEFFDTV